MIRSHWFLFLVSVTVSGCGGFLSRASYARVDSSYVGQNHSGRTLVIVPVAPDAVQIKKVGDFERDFKDDERYRDWVQQLASSNGGLLPDRHREVFLSERLASHLQQAASTRWHGVQVASLPAASSNRTLPAARRIKCDLPKYEPPKPERPTNVYGGSSDEAPTYAGTFEIGVPDRDVAAKHEGSAGFALVVDNVLFRREKPLQIAVNAPAAGAWPGSASNTPPDFILLTFDYAVYDYDKDKLVACGHAVGSHSPGTETGWTFRIAPPKTSANDWLMAADVALDDLRVPFWTEGGALEPPKE